MPQSNEAVQQFEAVFYLSITPGLEDLAALELQWWVQKFNLNVQIQSKDMGGITVEASFADGLTLNHILKIPQRILLRMGEFKAKDRMKLFNRLKKVRWGDYIGRGKPIWKVSCQKSKLNNEKWVEQVCEEAYQKYRLGQPAKESSASEPQEFYIRIYEDAVTLSVNTSGENLYKRGYKQKSVRAPLRESFAAAGVELLLKHSAKAETVIDPMCGSGTLLFEHFIHRSFVQTRSFAYQNFAKRPWDEVLAKLHKRIKSEATPCAQALYLGNDRSEEALESAKSNSEGLAGFKDKAHWTSEDLFKQQASEVSQGNSLVISNPPYNERLAWKSQKYMDWVEQVDQLWSPEWIAILLPQKASSQLKSAKGYQKIDHVSFKNGGIPVEWQLLKRVRD